MLSWDLSTSCFWGDVDDSKFSCGRNVTTDSGADEVDSIILRLIDFGCMCSWRRGIQASLLVRDWCLACPASVMSCGSWCIFSSRPGQIQAVIIRGEGVSKIRSTAASWSLGSSTVYGYSNLEMGRWARRAKQRKNWSDNTYKIIVNHKHCTQLVLPVTPDVVC